MQNQAVKHTVLKGKIRLGRKTEEVVSNSLKIGKSLIEVVVQF